jgi:hypothetical protein
MSAAIVGRHEAEQLQITSLFVSRFVTGPDQPLPVAYPNRPFQQPTGAPWARFSIRPGECLDFAVGGLVARSIGLVYLQIFLLADAGEVFARQIADLFAAAFDNQLLSYAGTGVGESNNDSGFIWFARTSFEPTGPRPGYVQFNAKIPYQHDRRGHGVGQTT